jgi:hypothetical protein
VYTIVPKTRQITFGQLVEAVHRGELEEVSYDEPVKIKGQRLYDRTTLVVWSLVALPATLAFTAYIVAAVAS